MGHHGAAGVLQIAVLFPDRNSLRFFSYDRSRSSFSFKLWIFGSSTVVFIAISIIENFRSCRALTATSNLADNRLSRNIVKPNINGGHFILGLL